MVFPKFTRSFFEDESLLLKKLQNFLKQTSKDKFSILILQKSASKIFIPLAALGYRRRIPKENKENLARYLRECWYSIEHGPLSLLNINIALYNYIETRKVELEGIRLLDYLMYPSVTKTQTIFKILFEDSTQPVIQEGAGILQTIMQTCQFVKIYTNPNEEYDEILNDDQLRLVEAKLRLYIVNKMIKSKNHFDIQQLRKEFNFVPIGPNPDTESVLNQDVAKASLPNADQNQRDHDLEKRKERIRIFEQRLSFWKSCLEYRTNSSINKNAPEQIDGDSKKSIQETILKIENVATDATSEKSFPRADVVTKLNDETNKKRKITSSDHEDTLPCKTNEKNISDEVDSATIPGSMHSNSPKLPRKKRLVFDLSENKYELIAIP